MKRLRPVRKLSCPIPCLVIVCVLLFLSGCAEVPVTHRKGLHPVPESQLLTLSFQQYSEVLKKSKLSTDQNEVQMVRPVGQRVAKAAELFLKESGEESVEADLYKAVLLKAQSIMIFDDIRTRLGIDFGGRVLEIGAGMGFLCAYMKKILPGLSVVYSDVSLEAARKAAQFESFFGSRIDEKWVTSAEDLPFEDEAFDDILFNASFHQVAALTKVRGNGSSNME